MDTDWEDRVRARAYAIWEREGQLEGGAERHWTQAEEEERAEARAKARRPPPRWRGLPGGPSAGPRRARADTPGDDVVAVCRADLEDGAVARLVRRGAWNQCTAIGRA